MNRVGRIITAAVCGLRSLPQVSAAAQRAGSDLDDTSKPGRISPADPASPSQVVDLAAVVDEGPLGGARILVFVLILLAVFTDGYDITVISYLAPAITADWHLRSDAMASIFSAGLAGMIVGALVMGMLADWRGRRTALLASLVLSGLAMLGSSTATGVISLAAWRFATGIGVGAILPVGLVLAAEYAPRRMRTTLLALLFFGFSVGGTSAAGWAATSLLPAHGWRWLLAFGGCLGLAGALILAPSLPESLKFLFARRPHSSALLRNALRLDPSIRAGPETEFVWTGESDAPPRASYRLLFSDGRRGITIALWVAMFAAQVTVYGLMLWLPTLLSAAGLDAGAIALVVVLLAVGSSIGAVTVSWFVDRVGPIALAVLPFAGIPSLIAIPLVGLEASWLIPLIMISGAAVGGVLQGLIIVAGQFYPTTFRANGVGAAVFISRFGSVLGPYVLGMLMLRGGTTQTFFYACAAPLAVAGAGVVVLGLLERARVRRSAATGNPDNAQSDAPALAVVVVPPTQAPDPV